MSFASQREKLLTAVREIAEKKERRDRERAVASASEPSISNSNEDKERKKLAKEEKERKRELEKQIREQRREKKAKEREERKEEKRYTKGQGAPAPKSDALLLGDLLLDDYDAAKAQFEETDEFLRTISEKITKQTEIRMELESETKELADEMRSFAFKNCVTPVDECLHKTADLNIFVSTITGKMNQAFLSYLGDEFYLRCKKKLERAEATKKDFNLLLDAYQEIEEKIRYQTNKEKTVSTAAMAKLSQAEEKKIVIKERLQQFGNATLERLQCINNEVNNKIVEHMCTYIEAQYEYFKEGFEEFSRAIPVISEFRNYIAKAKYEDGERRLRNDAKLEELGEQKDFKKLVKKKSQPEADKLAAKADKMILTPSMPKRRATKAPRMNLPMLHIVASEGHVDALVALLEAQADVNILDGRGWTALHHACSHGQLDACNALLQRGINPNIANNEGNTALHIACLMEREDCVIALGKAGALLNIKNRAGETCLHIACRLGNVSIVRRLLRYGADTQITGANGNAVQVSMAHGQLEVCQALAQHQYAKQQGEPIPGWEDAFDRDESAISSSSMSSSNGNTTATTATTTTTTTTTSSSNELRTSPTGAVNIRLSRAQSPGVSPASTPSRSFSRNASSPGPESDAATSPGALFKANTSRLALQPSFLPQFEGLSSDDEYDDDDGGLDPDLPTFSAPNLFIDEADDSDLGTPPSSPLRTRRSTRDSSLPVSFADDTIGVTIGRYPTEVSSIIDPTSRRRSTSLTDFRGVSAPPGWLRSRALDESPDEGSDTPDSPAELLLQMPPPPPPLVTDSNIVFFPEALSFEVSCKSRKQNVILPAKKKIITVERDRIIIRGNRKNKPKDFHVSLLLQCIRSRRRAKKLRVVWKFATSPDTYTFLTKEQRERFIQATWVARYGMNPTANPGYVATLNVFIGTWNMGAAVPTAASLEAFIPRDSYDLYAIGVQECVYQPGEGYDSCEADWFGRLQDHLGSSYIKLAGLSLSNIRLLVLVRRSHYYAITNIKTALVPTGLGGVMGNKGGVGVCFAYHDTTICLVDSHLAAHQDQEQARNANYRDIVRFLSHDLYFDNPAFDITNQFDHLFWFGDLNYRIDLPRDEALELIRQKNWLALLERDQLVQQIASQNAFTDFLEESIVFRPTYKYVRGKSDVYTEEKSRVPSWCDRVLWKSVPGSDIQHTAYGCCDNVTISDHHPVFSTFQIAVRVPRPPPLPNAPRYRIRISNLRIEGVRFASNEGTPDPYISFFGRFLADGKGKQTTVKTKTRYPCWEDSEVPLLPTLASNPAELRSHALQLLIEDKSQASKKEERAAQGRVPLWQASHNSPGGVSFAITLASNAWSMCGVVHGVLFIETPPSE